MRGKEGEEGDRSDEEVRSCEIGNMKGIKKGKKEEENTNRKVENG